MDVTELEVERITQGADPVERLNELTLTINDHYFDVGCLLYYLKENDIYKTVDGNVYYSDNHSRWKQFCEDKLSVSYRTAQYWLNMYRYFNDLGVSREKLQGLGWSKAKELIDITEEPETLHTLIDQAEGMTIGELRAYIKDYVKLDSAPKVVNFKKFVFNLPAAQAEHAEEILRIAEGQCDGNLNEGFWKIILEWYQTFHPLPADSEEVYLELVDEEPELEAQQI